MLVFDNYLSARRVAREIDAQRVVYEESVTPRHPWPAHLRFGDVSDCDDDDPAVRILRGPPTLDDYYFLEATGQRINVADWTDLVGPIQVLS